MKSLGACFVLLAFLAFTSAASAGTLPASSAAGLERLRASIFEVPGPGAAQPGKEGLPEALSPRWQPKTNCQSIGNACDRFHCYCIEQCQPCGGVAQFSCQDFICQCVIDPDTCGL